VENGRYREITINGRVTPCHSGEGGADTPSGEKRRSTVKYEIVVQKKTHHVTLVEVEATTKEEAVAKAKALSQKGCFVDVPHATWCEGSRDVVSASPLTPKWDWLAWTFRNGGAKSHLNGGYEQPE
jgi:hypothetical protein